MTIFGFIIAVLTSALIWLVWLIPIILLALPFIRWYVTRWHGVTYKVVYKDGSIVYMSGQLGNGDKSEVVSMERKTR